MCGGAVWEEGEPRGGSRGLGLAGCGCERKNEAGMLQGRGARGVGVNWVIPRGAPLLAEPLARDAVKGRERGAGGAPPRRSD